MRRSRKTSPPFPLPYRSAVLCCERCREVLTEVGVDVSGPGTGTVWWAPRGHYEVEDQTKPGEGIRTVAKV